MFDLIGSGSAVQAATQALKSATQQDDSSVQGIDPNQAGQRSVNAVQTASEAQAPNHNTGLKGERP
jgi:hypothetical protein